MRQHFEKHGDYTPAEHHDALLHGDIYPEEVFLELTNAQDYVAAVGQGAIVDRTQERLVASDLGVALVRRLFLREIAARRAGKPTKNWVRLNEQIELQSTARQEAIRA
jgi:5,5'-dehydrodivanillate O-demethylase